MRTFLGLSSVEWTGLYTIVTLGLLVVALVAALYAKRQWENAQEQTEAARKALWESCRP